VQQFKPIAIVERGVGRHGTHVYTATMDEKQVVVKVAPACDIDCEVSSMYYEQRKQCRHCNTLELAFAECYTVTYICCLVLIAGVYTTAT
jgi:hypothetical protein